MVSCKSYVLIVLPKMYLDRNLFVSVSVVCYPTVMCVQRSCMQGFFLHILLIYPDRSCEVKKIIVASAPDTCCSMNSTLLLMLFETKTFLSVTLFVTFNLRFGIGVSRRTVVAEFEIETFYQNRLRGRRLTF